MATARAQYFLPSREKFWSCFLSHKTDNLDVFLHSLKRKVATHAAQTDHAILSFYFSHFCIPFHF